MPAVTGLIPHVVPADEVQTAIAMNNVLSNASRFIGAALVGLIITVYGTAAAFAYNATSLILVTLPMFAVHVVIPRRAREAEPFTAQLVAGFRFAKRHSAVGHLLVLNTVVGFFIMQQPLLSLITRDLLHSGASTFGLLQSVTGLGAIAGAIFAGRYATDAKRKTALAVAVLATALSVIGVASSWWVPLSIAVQMLFGFGLFTLMTVSVSIITMSTPDRYLGRVMALHGMTIAGMVPINAMVAGLVANVIGTRATMGIAGVLLFTYVSWFVLRRLSRIHVVRPEDQEEVAVAVPVPMGDAVAPLPPSAIPAAVRG
jgi:MFS family permease